MYVCPDSSDLIELHRCLGRGERCHLERLEEWLLRRQATVVLSTTVIKELALPAQAGTGIARDVVRVLDFLERLPHTWFRTTDLHALELQTAVRCFTSQRPCEQVRPFVGTILDTMSWTEPWDLWRARQMSLAEFVTGLAHTVDRVNPLSGSIEEWLRLNREHSGRRRDAFKSMLTRHGPRVPELQTVDVDALAQHLWKSPDWCPGMQLSFEVTQAFIDDRATKGDAGHMDDLVRIAALPYVDVLVADGNKRNYLDRLRSGRDSRLRRCAYWERCRVVRSLQDAYGL